MTRVAAAAFRLKKRAEFVAAAAGHRFHTPRMTVQGIMRSPDADVGAGVRVGFTVTKRIGNSPERNRIRRRLRAAADIARRSWPEAPLDLVLVARREAIAAPFEQLVEDLRRAAPALLAGKGAPAPKHVQDRSRQDRSRRRGRGAARAPGDAQARTTTDNSP
ncbi:ribonuclease P protein component [Camelimonas abortus]|uniref:Ribonuclease P protein component n=1 Tax=Camelimonas abortus TaxID=1017184 RepID=A0ABV7LB00_9HYPH